jgi:hypothetical protein
MAPSSPRPTPSRAECSGGPPEPHETQLRALAELRASAGARRVRVLSVTIVTDSVQMLVEVSQRGRGCHRALIAPSGRIHRL